MLDITKLGLIDGLFEMLNGEIICGCEMLSDVGFVVGNSATNGFPSQCDLVGSRVKNFDGVLLGEVVREAADVGNDNGARLVVSSEGETVGYQ
jgi:hypothetical protein